MAATREEVQAYTAKALRRLQSSDPAGQKAALANLRRGVGHAPGDIPQLWGEFLLDLPETLYGKDGQASPAEWAVYTALTLFALHQQGHDPAKAEWMHEKGEGLGKAVGRLATDEDAMKRVLRRLNAAATANSVTALTYYLRGLVQLLRAESIPLDYVALAGELYRYQFPESVGQVRLRWGQDFYSEYNKNSKEEKES